MPPDLKIRPALVGITGSECRRTVFQSAAAGFADVDGTVGFAHVLSTSVLASVVGFELHRAIDIGCTATVCQHDVAWTAPQLAIVLYNNQAVTHSNVVDSRDPGIASTTAPLSGTQSGDVPLRGFRQITSSNKVGARVTAAVDTELALVEEPLNAVTRRRAVLANVA